MSGANQAIDSTPKLIKPATIFRTLRVHSRRMNSSGRTETTSWGRVPIAADAARPRAMARRSVTWSGNAVAAHSVKATNISAGPSDSGSVPCTSIDAEK